MNNVLVGISGRASPGMVAAALTRLAAPGVQVLDIHHSQVHEHLHLSALLRLDDPARFGDLERRLQTLVQELQLNLHLSPVEDERLSHWVRDGEAPRWILTLLGRRLEPGQIAAVADTLATHGLDVDGIERLSGRLDPTRRDAASNRACVELSARGAVADEALLRHDLLALTNEEAFDLSIQADDLFRTHRRLIVFDMDSTLIQCEVMDELAKLADVGDEVATITAAAMRGEIDFNESFRRRLGTLAGLDASVLEQIADDLPITPGADRLIGTLKRLDYRIGILSGGFTFFAEHLQRRWGLDAIAANQLDVADGRLTGRVIGDIVNGERKAQLLREMAAAHGLDLRQTIAVGDGANDLPMLEIAGLGVAFHAKPIVRRNAQHAISTLGLDAILYLLGIHDRLTG